jgi:crotonobetaine/carnitine-CoA ligase
MNINGKDVYWHNIDQLIEDKANKHGDAIFATIDGKDLSYRELERQSKYIAYNLLELGMQKGDRISTLLPNCVEIVLTWFGIARMGGIWTPLNAGLIGADLEHTLRDSGTKVVVTDRENRRKIDGVDPSLRSQFQTFVIDDRESDYLSFELLTAPNNSSQSLPDVAPGDPALILYTGGTTGLPKGVVTPSLSLIYGGMRYAEGFEVKEGERHFTTLPLFHAIAVQMAIMGPLMYDMTTVIDKRFSVSNYWRRVKETGANIIDPIGAMLTMLCQQPERHDDTDHKVRVSIGVWNQIPDHIPHMFKLRFGIPMVDVYGISEGGGACITTNRLSDYTAGSNGNSHGWYEMRVADENEIPVAPGVSGQIFLRPLFPHMGMISYHNAPDKTLEALRDLWLRTGDIGHMDESGNFYFGGRKAHWIRRRSENISAYEIEAILGQHSSIREVVVVGVPAEIGEDDIKAYIILDATNRVEPHDIAAWCVGKLAPFKIPRYIEFVDEFPRSLAKGEVERGVLKKRPHADAWDREKEQAETAQADLRASAPVQKVHKRK